MRRATNAQEFLELGERLGVIDVRIAGEDDCLYVFVASGHGEEELTAIRLLANAHWPACKVVIAVRSPLVASGSRRVDEDDATHDGEVDPDGSGLSEAG